MKCYPLDRKLAFLASTVCVAGLLVGCGTTSGYKQADKTGAGIASFREEVLVTKGAIDKTMQSLGAIAASADTNPRKAYEQYVKDVASLESTAKKLVARGQDMRQQGQAYFDQWEKQLAEVKNQDIQKLAVERKAKLSEAFDRIRQACEPLKAQFDTWMSDLKDLQTYLGNDLTIGGVDAAKGLFSKTTNEGLEVQKRMDTLVAELNSVSATITPANVPPPKPK